MTAKTIVSYLGHSTILIEMDGLRILTDPILRDRISFLHRTSPAVDPRNYSGLDAILISHLHYDHLDPGSLRLVGDQPTLFGPYGSGRVLDKNGFSNHRELRIGETIQLGPISILATFADHTRTRHPMGPAADCIGFIISGTYKIYFPGDTREFPEMAGLADEKLDLALMPVWGWGPDRGRMHMGPREAAESLNLLRPRLAVPIHWGTFIPFWLKWFKPGFHYFPPLDFAAHAKKIAPQVGVHILLPGESLYLNG